MIRKHTLLLTATMLLFALGLVPQRQAAAQDTAVRAVLFYSPTCGHCHYVIEEVLIPMADQYGDRLQVIGINISEPGGRVMYEDTLAQLELPENRRGVPLLVVGETVLIGSGEIPEQFPGLVETLLAQGGIGWPNVPGLPDVLAANGLDANAGPVADATQAPAPTAIAASVAADAPEAGDVAPEAALPPALALDAAASETVWDRVGRDPLGNGLAIAVLAGLIAALVFAIGRLWRVAPGGLSYDDWPAWKASGVAALAVVGLGVSAYMAYVETTQTTAVCGPVGDCNTVQQSEYAAILGIPVGILGLVGYGLVLLSWAGVMFGRGALRRAATWALPVLALCGTAFSIYLTFLEPFVIGASCAWCLTSAVTMLLILLLSLPPGPQAVPQTAGRARLEA